MENIKLQTPTYGRWHLEQTMYYNHANPAGSNTQYTSQRENCLGTSAGPRMVAMKNIYEVLRSKEMDLVRLRTEVDALRLVVPLLAELIADSSEVGAATRPDVVWRPALQKNKWPLKVGHPASTYSDS